MYDAAPSPVRRRMHSCARQDRPRGERALESRARGVRATERSVRPPRAGAGRRTRLAAAAYGVEVADGDGGEQARVGVGGDVVAREGLDEAHNGVDDEEEEGVEGADEAPDNNV